MNAHVDRLERQLARPAQGVFDDDALAGVPDQVARYLRSSVTPGTPLWQSAHLAMRGRIRLKRWTRFRGHELIAPSAGFVWAVRAGPITGYDRYANGDGEMRWKLLGLVPLMLAHGPDTTRSAAGRLAGEAVWLPTALLSGCDVRWTVYDDRNLTAHLTVGSRVVDVRLGLDAQGQVTTCAFERWGDPDQTGTYALYPFGMEATAHRTFGGVTIPSAGRAGWHYGTDRWDDGVFFEYAIDDLRPIA